MTSTYGTGTANDMFTSGYGYKVTACNGNGIGSRVSNGNPLSVQGPTSYSFVYNQENDVTTLVNNGNSETFAYDGDGNRVSKTLNGVTTYYVYHGSTIVEEIAGANQIYWLPDFHGKIRLHCQ